MSTPKPRPVDPEPLPLPVTDNHTHIDYENPDEIAELLQRAAAAGVNQVIQIGCSVESAQRTLELSKTYPAIAGGVAIHPNYVADLAQKNQLHDALAQIEQYAEHPSIRVISETGLDYYRSEPDDHASKLAQQESFRWHINLAKKLGKPLQIHNRAADADTLTVLDDEGAPEKTIMHCFSSDEAMAQECLDRGFYLSFSGNVTFKNAQNVRDALLLSPPERTLVETDAPYLAPMPHRGKPNSSYLIPHIVRYMADVRDLPVVDVCEGLRTANHEVYGTWVS